MSIDGLISCNLVVKERDWILNVKVDGIYQ